MDSYLVTSLSHRTNKTYDTNKPNELNKRDITAEQWIRRGGGAAIACREDREWSTVKLRKYTARSIQRTSLEQRSNSGTQWARQSAKMQWSKELSYLQCQMAIVWSTLPVAKWGSALCAWSVRQLNLDNSIHWSPYRRQSGCAHPKWFERTSAASNPKSCQGKYRMPPKERGVYLDTLIVRAA